MAHTPTVDELHEVVDVLGQWQSDTPPVQLHPGDVGWFWRFGADATAAAVRTWMRAGQIIAVGLLDGVRLLRLAIAPDARQDDDLAAQLLHDLTQPGAGVLMAGEAYLEAPQDALIHDRLAADGWVSDEPWTPLRRDLTEPVEDPEVRIEVINSRQAPERAEVHRASFDGSTFTVDRWYAMAAGTPYADARCVLARDEHGTPVAAATVWSAGPGRPGLLEPVAAHPEHRGQGFGKAIVIAGASVLRSLGSSSAVVIAPSSNVGAVAAYRSAGFVSLPEVRDRRRPG